MLVAYRAVTVSADPSSAWTTSLGLSLARSAYHTTCWPLFSSKTATITPEIVKAHCRARLAAYKVPKAVEFVSGLPRTESGKIKRFELQALGRKETA